MHYTYLVGVGIALIPWLVIFWRRADLRSQMVFAGLLGAVIGSTGSLYVPYYWNPPTLGNLLSRYGVSLEDVLLGFFIGGVAAVLYEYVNDRRTKRPLIARSYPNFLSAAVFVCAFVGGLSLLPLKPLHVLVIAMLLGAVVVVIYRQDLVPEMLWSCLWFAALYWGLFSVFNWLFPDFIVTYYNHDYL
ncbi:MAG: hypothetical protein U1C53_02735, partial [Candidatus Veblenbacteria bacterium]|nr:hypothetical protein [Candidatus Veblenbacteria bacterium]